jgi:hypothetical protein
VIRGADGNLVTVRVREAQSMMRGTLARVTIEHDDGTIETRIIDRDADVWLMPDLPPDKPAPVEERPGIELTYGEDLRAGDTITYMRGGQYLEGQITSIEDRNDERRATMADGNEVIFRPAEMRTRVGRGPESSTQPHLYTVKLSAQPETISGLDVQPGDRVEMNIFDPPARGTVLSIEEATGEDGTTGRYVTFSDDTGAIMTAMLFESMHVTRFAKGDDNAAATLQQMATDRETRERRNDVIQTLENLQNHQISTAADMALHLALGSGRDAVIREIEQRRDGLYVSQDVGNRLARGLGIVDDPAAGRTLAKQVSRDAFERLLRSVRTAYPLEGETETDMLRRVLDQHIRTPPQRNNREIAQSLMDSVGALSQTQEVTAPSATPTHGDLSARIASYRESLGGRFGHSTTRRATYGTLNLDALERGEAPPITYEDRYTRDRAPDGGPGETAMRHLEILRAAGADIDADVQARVLERLSRANVTLPDDAQGMDLPTYMQQQQDLSAQLSKARNAAYIRMQDFETATADERAAARREWRDIADRHTPLVMKLEALQKPYATALREATREVLSGLRQIGGVRLDYQAADATQGPSRYRMGQGRNLSERDQNVRAMRTAENVLPADWLNSIRDHVRTSYRRSRIGLGPLARGHADYRGNIRLTERGEPRFDGDPGRGRVAVHELSHFAERAVPGILEAESAWLWSRTSTGGVNDREREALINMNGNGGDSTQFGYRDDFRRGYTGVDYSRSEGHSQEAYEILTTGVESLFAGSDYLDDDQRRWLLGALALL